MPVPGQGNNDFHSYSSFPLLILSVFGRWLLLFPSDNLTLVTSLAPFRLFWFATALQLRNGFNIYKFGKQGLPSSSQFFHQS
jgi:hypothetical protein